MEAGGRSNGNIARGESNCFHRLTARARGRRKGPDSPQHSDPLRGFRRWERRRGGGPGARKAEKEQLGKERREGGEAKPLPSLPPQLVLQLPLSLFGRGGRRALETFSG